MPRTFRRSISMSRTYAVLCIAAIVLLVACQQTQTVEEENFGMTERYEVHKKTGLKHGKFERFDPEGNLFERANYSQDTLQGERTLFYASGTPEIVEKYDAGILDGSFITYYENGEIELEGQYDSGVMYGVWKRYYESSQLMEEVTFADNMENGPFVEYHENGKLKAEGQYKGGDREQGLLKLYDENGELYKTMECDDGICHTTWSREEEEMQGDE